MLRKLFVFRHFVVALFSVCQYHLAQSYITTKCVHEIKKGIWNKKIITFNFIVSDINRSLNLPYSCNFIIISIDNAL